MSKKKTMATMSLKDFHGGSIPSDLPLPSAPGLVVRSGSDRNVPANLGNNPMRSDLRPRPKSSGATHGFDEKVTFLSHPSPIGRNFDEDERKPLDGSSAPRRTISDESVRGSAPVRQEFRPDYASSIRVPDRPVSSPVPQSPGLTTAALSPIRLGGSENLLPNEGLAVKNSKAASGDNSLNGNNARPNAWGVRKDVTGFGEMGGTSVSSGMNEVSRFAQASAVEKVSSGMWQSKTPNNLLPHLIYSRRNVVTHGVSDRGEYGASRGSQAVTDPVAEDGNQVGEKEWPSYGQPQTQMYAEGVQTGGTIAIQQSSVTSLEISERSVLTVLPRSKPLETSEINYRQGYQQSTESGQHKDANELHGYANPSKPLSMDVKTNNQLVERVVERPKLNLKPRSQPLLSDGSLERERNSLFGGARPRELVLKERGVDEDAINNVDLSHSPGSISSSKKEVVSEQLVPPARSNQKIENHASNRRTGKDFERKDQRLEHEKVDAERKNWRNDKWRSCKDAKEQRPELETWRRPLEEPKPASPDTSFRQGKLVSALELAQAFSKSVSDPKSPDLHPTQRSLPAHNNHQVPFSRLTVPTTTHRINS